MSRQAPLVFVMAAGLGTRMKSDRPKVLHPIAGRPMLHWVVNAARAAGAERVVAILGHKHEQVKASLDASFGADRVEIALQPEQRGTGHAVQCALPVVADEPDDRIVVILTGDAPLLADRADRRADRGLRGLAGGDGAAVDGAAAADALRPARPRRRRQAREGRRARGRHRRAAPAPGHQRRVLRDHARPPARGTSRRCARTTRRASST